MRQTLMSAAMVGVLAGVMAVCVVSEAAAQMPPKKISADVVAVSGHELRVRTSAGQIETLILADNARFSGRSAASLDGIIQGAFVGTTAAPQPDGTLLASEVHIFPESMRGTGEGHGPMDTVPGSTMTNATVVAVGTARPSMAAGSTMTNATVTTVAESSVGRRMTLQYKGGEKVVVVPPHVPVVMVEAADRSMLVPGAHVIVYASMQSDGTMTANRVTIGKNGFVPPA